MKNKRFAVLFDVFRKNARFGCLFFLFFIPPSVSEAAHIVGGDISYRFLRRPTPNTVEFEFTMYIYRDAFSTGASFDEDAFIGEHSKTPNSSSYTSEYFSTPLISQRNVAPPVFPCLTPSSNVGVQEGLYRFTRTLRADGSDYVLVYQRCCRNNTISNIFSPGAMGASYSIEITAAAIAANNSSPVFNSFPPIFICVNQPLTFNHSATDADADQIVYNFCNAYSGGSQTSPVVTNPPPPPFPTVTYVAPTYTANAPLGGNPVVRINPNTGLITGTPVNEGQFVATVCMEEYRNGVLFTRTYRDFQFNIISCRRDITAQIIADSIRNKVFFTHTCFGQPLNINNTSGVRANINNLQWQFLRGEDTLRSTDWSPTFTFPDTGRWFGTLHLNPGLPCSDSARITTLVGGKITGSFDFQYDTCVAGPVQFSNGRLSASFPLVKQKWIFGDGREDSINLVNIAHRYDSAGIKTVRIYGRDRIGCESDISRSFEWRPAPNVIIVEPSRFVGCEPAIVRFVNRSMPIDTSYKVLWEFGDNSPQYRGINAQHTYEKSGIYSVRIMITSPLKCYKEATFKSWIRVNPGPKADFEANPKFVNIFNPEYQFKDLSKDSIVAWRWTFGDGGTSIKQNPQHYYRDTGTYNVGLYVTNNFGCRDSMFKIAYIKPEVRFYMPSAFTPNEDASNEVYKGVGFTYGMRDFELTIWNRWGEIVFQTNDNTEGWNGKKNNVGDNSPQGVYLYLVKYKTPQNTPVELRGYTTLYR